MIFHSSLLCLQGSPYKRLRSVVEFFVGAPNQEGRLFLEIIFSSFQLSIQGD